MPRPCCPFPPAAEDRGQPVRGLVRRGSPEQLPLAEPAAPQPDALQAATSIAQPAAAKTAEPIQAAKASRREGVKTQMPDPQHFRPGLPAGSSDIAVSRGSHVGSPNSLLDRGLPLPTLKDVRPTLGSGPGDSLPGAVHAAQPRAEPDGGGLPAGSLARRPRPDRARRAGDQRGGRIVRGHRPAPVWTPPRPGGRPGNGLRGAVGPPAIGPEAEARRASVRPGVAGGPGIGVALPSRRQGFSDREIPGIYKGRVAPDRSLAWPRSKSPPKDGKAVAQPSVSLPDARRPMAASTPACTRPAARCGSPAATARAPAASRTPA